MNDSKNQLNDKSVKQADSDSNTYKSLEEQELSNLVTKWIKVLNLKVAEETVESKLIRVRGAEQALERALETPEASKTRIAIESLQILNSKIVRGKTSESLKAAVYLALERPEEELLRLSHRRQGNDHL